METINLHDKDVWKLFAEGKTKGIFQLESNLGKSWAKRLEPNSIEELAALVSLLRPGCLKAIQDGKSMTQHFVDRKHGRDKVTYLHDSLEDILRTTYGVIVYQEQSMRIAQKLAGFNLQEADELRKAIGKKKADLMVKVKAKFLEGCKKVGIVDDEKAKEIFGQIEKSSRYAFNKSHAIAYAINSYHSAWYKHYYPLQFFLSYLKFSGEKQNAQQEVYELVSEAKLFDIHVKIPNLNCYALEFNINGKDIHFGLKDIKSMTGVTSDRVMEFIPLAEQEAGKSAKDFTWMDILVYLSPKLVSTSFKALASIGFFSNAVTGINRSKALYEYMIFKQLTKAELEWVLSNYPTRKWESLKQCFVELAPTKANGGGTFKEDRSKKIWDEVKFIDNPPYALDDTPIWIVEQEKKFLGCPISLSKIDTADTSAANTTCKELSEGRFGEGLCVVGSVTRVNNAKTKKGKNPGQLMAFLSIEDDTCSYDSIVVFPKIRKEAEHLLYDGNNLLLCGSVKKGDSFIVDKIHEI